MASNGRDPFSPEEDEMINYLKEYIFKNSPFKKGNENENS